MKTFATCFLLVGAVASIAYAYPARSDSKADPSDDAEFIVVPLEHQRPSYFNRYPSSFDAFDGVLDTDDFPHPGQSQNPLYFPSINPFTWQFSSYLDDLMKRVRDRFAGSWNPFYGGGDFAPSGPGLFPIDISDVDVDDAEGGQKNSTSTVKVIDGHKVIINDTYYTKKTDFGTSVFKVRVIDVKPVDDESGEEGGDKTTTEKSIETGNRSGAPKDGEKADADDEDGEGKKEPTTETAPKRDTELDSSDEEVSPADDSLNTIDTNKDKDIDGGKKDVDELSASSAIESFEGESPLAKLAISSPERSESLERNALNSELNEDSVEDSDDIVSPDEWKQHQDDRKRIVVGIRYPNRNQNQLSEQEGDQEIVDLTHDIAINDMLADQSIPLHPDVEVFAPNRRRPVQHDPMQPFPMFPTFPQPFPGGNRFPTIPFPNQFPQQFPQRPIGQFPVQTFPMFPQQQPQNPMFGGQHPGQQFPIQRPATVPTGGFGQQTPVLMMTFPPGFPAFFREVRP